MNTWNDLWQYICNNGGGRNELRFYCSNPNEVAKAFWNGMLTTLEMEGKITREQGMKIWKEIEES